MINKFFSKDNNYIHLLTILAFLLPLPLKENITSILIIIIVLYVATFNGKSLFNFQRLKSDFFFKINGIIFLLFVFGLFWSNDYLYSIVQLQKMLPFIVFPLLISSYQYSEKKLITILKSFIFGLVLYTVILIINVYSLYLTNEVLNSRIGLNFVLHSFIRKTQVSIHHAYVGVYMSFAIIICIHILKTTINKSKKLLYTIILIYFMLLFPWLAGKTSIFILVFIFSIYFYYYRRNLSYKWGAFFLIFFMIGISLLFRQYEWVKILLESAIDKRLNIFKAGYLATLDNLPFGIGNNDIKIELKKYFLRNQNNDLIGMAAHNSFLSFSIRFGVLGFFVLLWYYIFLFREGLKRRKILFLLLVTIIFLSSLSEHLYDTHRGRFFSLFFLSLIYYAFKTKKKLVKK